jgi:hypothetical protein
MKKIEPTAYQADVLTIPESISVLLAGGRGGGKTTAVELVVIRHCEKHRDRARVLIVRETLKALSEFEDALQSVLSAVYPRGVKINRQEHTFRLPNGAIIECAPLDGPADYDKLQGRSFSLVVVEEAGNFRSMKWIDMLRSNLRAGDVPTRMIMTANPGGRMHQAIHSRYIARGTPWVPMSVDGRAWVWAPSTLLDNPHLPAEYRADLLAACGRDKELGRAWIEGSWKIARGAFFGDVLDEARQKLSAPELAAIDTQHRKIYTFVAADWGISAPSVAFACVHTLGPYGRYPAGSLLLLDEVHSAEPDDWSVGRQWPPGRLADAINAMCERTGVNRHGVIDDARGLGPDETLIKLLREEGLYFYKPAKGRAEGWAKVRELAFNSLENNGRPGLWVSERCEGFWATVPTIPRDPIRPEDLDSAATDHWADASRYAATHRPRIAVNMRMDGTVATYL